MSQPEQPSPTKHPRSAQGTKHTAGKHVAATDNKVAGQPMRLPGDGGKWGEFPSEERQDALRIRMEVWKQEPDHGNRPGPFAQVFLDGASVYWLVALVAGAGDVGVGEKYLLDFKNTGTFRLGAVLSNLHLEGAYLFGFGEHGEEHLEGAVLFKAHLEGAILRGAHLEGAHLVDAHLEDAVLVDAHLEGADLRSAHLERAGLSHAHLEGASLFDAHLEGASLFDAHLEDAHMSRAHLTNQVALGEATFDVTTDLDEVHLDATLLAADVLWNGVPLTRVDWRQVPRLGDEAEARQAHWSNGERKDKDQRSRGFEAAARAYRQLAIALRGQGITEAADRFTYRALIMQRKAFWWQLRNKQLSALGSYLFSLFLAVLTGYGFRMWRIVAAYILLILAFAGAYWSLDLQTPHIYTFWQALILSVTAFHGRVFSNPFLLTEPQIVVTAIEAIFGLVIEGVFIAMLTQRFFNR